MSSEKNDNLFISTYVKRQEGILIEHLRKQLEAETKSTLLEMAVNEQNKQIEELNNTIQSLQNTVEQSLNGVKIASIEKDKVSNDIQVLEKELHNLRHIYNEKNNTCVRLESELLDTRSKLNVLTNDNATLKNNYNIMLKALEDQDPEPTPKRLSKKKIEKTENAEWVDGN